MSWEALHAVAWMSVASICSWLLIDAFRSGHTIGFKGGDVRSTNPGGFWMVQGVVAAILAGAIYGLFRTLDGMS